MRGDATAVVATGPGTAAAGQPRALEALVRAGRCSLIISADRILEICSITSLAEILDGEETSPPRVVWRDTAVPVWDIPHRLWDAPPRAFFVEGIAVIAKTRMGPVAFAVDDVASIQANPGAAFPYPPLLASAQTSAFAGLRFIDDQCALVLSPTVFGESSAMTPHATPTGSESAQPASETLAGPLLLFASGPLWFATPLSDVHRLASCDTVHPLPFTPSWCPGVIRTDGEAWPVLDLRQRLGLANALDGALRYLLLVRSCRGNLALGVDDVRVHAMGGQDRGRQRAEDGVEPTLPSDDDLPEPLRALPTGTYLGRGQARGLIYHILDLPDLIPAVSST